MPAARLGSVPRGPSGWAAPEGRAGCLYTPGKFEKRERRFHVAMAVSPLRGPALGQKRARKNKGPGRDLFIILLALLAIFW